MIGLSGYDTWSGVEEGPGGVKWLVIHVQGSPFVLVRTVFWSTPVSLSVRMT